MECSSILYHKLIPNSCVLPSKSVVSETFFPIILKSDLKENKGVNQKKSIEKENLSKESTLLFYIIQPINLNLSYTKYFKVNSHFYQLTTTTKTDI